MHVLITGASKGIGAATAERLAVEHSDLRLSICARDETALATIRARIESVSSAHVFAMQCDVSDERSVAAFTSAADRAFGSIDMLINNAGIGYFCPVEQMATEDFDRVLSTNLRGVFLMTQAALPGMKLRKSGTIVTISSLAGRNGFAGGAAYCASKFGVRGLMQSLFLEVREFNIRVVTIFPGTVDTDFFLPMGGLSSEMKHPLLAEDVAHAVSSAIAVPGRATMSEIDLRPTNPK
jgi:NAD(P)-dependent dehydrogenase (short-subunit alcohol dehydrogenase family)